MAVKSWREVVPRTISHRFGETPNARRTFVITLTEPTNSQIILNATGIQFGSPHPEYAFLKAVNVSLEEQDRYHAELTVDYELPTRELDPNPLLRPDVWSFSVGGAAVPALQYFHGDGNGDIRPLVTAAGDFIEGLQTVEAEIKATISSNRPTFPLAVAAQVTNAINNQPYLGGERYTWQCAGISGTQASEMVNDQELRYWQISVELVFRASTWVLNIPHVGWHFIEGQQKRRAWAWNEDGSTKEDANTPQPLTEEGALKYPGSNGVPDRLLRRVNPSVNFSQFFGTPNL